MSIDIIIIGVWEPFSRGCLLERPLWKKTGLDSDCQKEIVTRSTRVRNFRRETDSRRMTRSQDWGSEIHGDWSKKGLISRVQWNTGGREGTTPLVSDRISEWEPQNNKDKQQEVYESLKRPKELLNRYMNYYVRRTIYQYKNCSRIKCYPTRQIEGNLVDTFFLSTPLLFVYISPSLFRTTSFMFLVLKRNVLLNCYKNFEIRRLEDFGTK